LRAAPKTTAPNDPLPQKFGALVACAAATHFAERVYCRPTTAPKVFRVWRTGCRFDKKTSASDNQNCEGNGFGHFLRTPRTFGLTMSDLTRILSAVDQGDPQAAESLLPLVYSELRKLAVQKMAREAPGQTLQATALVHEAYLRLVDGKEPQQWQSRGHFFAAAAEAMRRILIEQARRKRSLKGGGEFRRVDLAGVDPALAGPTLDLLALNEALDKLAVKDLRKAELVKLRFFAGLTNAQAAEALGISAATADTDWAYAKSWLRLAMSDAAPG
jgi:RNA polymerase sigma factor (TIGR02999 family)